MSVHFWKKKCRETRRQRGTRSTQSNCNFSARLHEVSLRIWKLFTPVFSAIQSPLNFWPHCKWDSELLSHVILFYFLLAFKKNYIHNVTQLKECVYYQQAFRISPDKRVKKLVCRSVCLKRCVKTEKAFAYKRVVKRHICAQKDNHADGCGQSALHVKSEPTLFF